MKKKFLDKELIAEGLAQLKLPGFIILVISLLGSVLPALFNWLSVKDDKTFIPSQNIIDITQVSMILVPIIFIAPFVFCFILFSFLNNRKGSDYYHSLPTTRICLFLSFTVSIIIWLFAIVVLTVLAPSLFYMATGMIFNPMFIPYLILTFFAGALLVTACMLLAMTLTGTVFTNIILFGLILFLPRYIMTLAVSKINDLQIVVSSVGGIANIEYNIPIHFLYSYFIEGGAAVQSCYTSVRGIVYTLIVSIIYLAIACVLFHFRKSESAGYAAPNKVLLDVYGCAITLPLAMIIPIMAIDYKSAKVYWQSHGFSTIVLAVISIAIYFIFEFVTSKNVKKMIKSAPALLVVVAICAILGITVSASKTNILKFTPAASEIESVSIYPGETANADIAYGINSARNSWFNDDSLISVVSETLNDNVKTLKSGNYINPQNKYHVIFHMKDGSYVEREIFASDDQSEQIKNWMVTNAEYSKYLEMLPPDSSIISVWSSSVSDLDAKKLWQTYKSEYCSLSKSDKQAIISYMIGLQPLSNDTSISSISIYGAVGPNNYRYSYPIYSKTPKTAALYFELCNKLNKAHSKSLMNKYLSSGKGVIHFNVFAYNIEGASLQQQDGNEGPIAYVDELTSVDSSKVKQCFNILLEQFDDSIDLKKPYVQVTVGDDDNEYRYYQAISNENAKAICDLHLEQSQS